MNMVYASLYLLQFLRCRSECRSFTFLVRFVPRYSILLEEIVNGIVFLISLCVSSLLAYKNATDFWILICIRLLWWIHLSVLVVSWWNLWGSLCTVSHHLQIKTVLLLPFQFRCIFFFLLVWFLWLGLPVLRWIRDESAHPCLFPDLKGNPCSFCTLSIMLAVGL